MRRRLTFGILLLAAFSLAVTTTAGKPAAPKPQNIPVTVALADRDVDRIQSDGLETYINGTDGVTAVIVPLGNLQLKAGTLRTFWLDFQGCVDLGSCSPPSFVADFRQGYMTTSCATPLPTMELGAFQDCNLNVHFTADQLGWFIRFGENEGTMPATVTHNQDGSWTIDVPSDGVALLQSYPLKGRVTWTDHGHFYMPVNLTVTLLP